jgi:hypothetical protein
LIQVADSLCHRLFGTLTRPSVAALERWLGVAAMAAVLVFALALAAYKVNSSDLPWHYKTGEWIVQQRRVPTVDFWNFLRTGQEWIDAQWLFQVTCYGVRQVFGPNGLSLLTMGAVAGALLLCLTAPWQVPLSWRALAALVFLLGIDGRIICRPELLSVVYMALMFHLLERARRGRTRWLAGVPAVQLLWANSEGLWPIGLGIIGVYILDLGLEAWRQPQFSWRRPVPPAWPGTLAAAAAVCLLQPYGLKGVWFPLQLLREVATEATLQKQVVVEFQSLFEPPPILRAEKFFFLLIAAATAVTAASGRRLRPGLSLLGLGFVYLGVSARRNVSVAGIALLPLMLAHLELLAAAKARPIIVRGAGIGAAVLALGAAAVLTVLCLVQPVRTWDRTGREPGLGLSRRYYPTGAVAFLKSIKYQGNIINNDRLGGYLFYAGWPEWMVMADPRQEIGGEQMLRRWGQVFQDDAAFRQMADQYHAEAVVIDLWDEYLQRFADRIGRDPGWALVYVDQPHKTLVFLRRVPRWEQVIQRAEIKG